MSDKDLQGIWEENSENSSLDFGPECEYEQDVQNVDKSINLDSEETGSDNDSEVENNLNLQENLLPGGSKDSTQAGEYFINYNSCDLSFIRVDASKLHSKFYFVFRGMKEKKEED